MFLFPHKHTEGVYSKLFVIIKIFLRIASEPAYHWNGRASSHSIDK